MECKPSPPAPLPARRERGAPPSSVAATELPAARAERGNSPLSRVDGRGSGGEGKRRSATGSKSNKFAFDIQTYAARIGYEGVLTPTLATLSGLHLAHLYSVPFENLDIYLGRPIVLDEDLLFDKVVRRRRGGFCYELNGLFAAFLRAIGFKVTLLAAQFPRPLGQSGPELDHLVLHVQGEDTAKPVLADVAAGRGSFAVPLQSGTRRVQAQTEAGASFRLTPEDGGQRLWRREPGGEWERFYRFGWRPRQLSEFSEGCRYHQTSPESHFTQGRICTLLTPTGRVTLSEHRLITTVNGARSERELADEAACRQALWTHFSIDLDA
jgi:N-hydroxyarylamine O-acetyltransferase